MKHAVLLSGGIDSTTVLSQLFNAKHPPSIFTFSIIYPSKHNALEIAAAKKVAAYFGVPHETLDLTPVFDCFQSALLTNSDEAIPEGHYTDKSMSKTVVPMRNVIFATILAGFIMSKDSESKWTIHIGAHAGDHAIYPDCRPDTLHPLAMALQGASDGKVFLEVPFLKSSKTEIVAAGLLVNAPYQLTRTCYTNQVLACGACGSCVERLEAFVNNLAVDPIGYSSYFAR
jgi:7-cyano-7-deazaguanine synthase